MASAQLLERRNWTYQEYRAIDDEGRYEIIDGELQMAPAPSLEHQRSAGSLYMALRRHVEEHGLGEVFFAPVDVILDESNVVQPDILFVARENQGILRSHGIAGAPDMVVEILSPATAMSDRNRKMDLYARFGVREYWIVDPAMGSIEIFLLVDGSYTLYSMVAEHGKGQSHVISGFEVEVSTVF